MRNVCIDNKTGIDLEHCGYNNIIGNICMRGNGSSENYSTIQHTIYLHNESTTYNLVAYNFIMGKNYLASGTGAGNTYTGNKYN